MWPTWKKLLFLPGLFSALLVLFLGDRATAGHFPTPVPNPGVWCDFLGNLKINGINTEIGDEVAFYNEQGDVLGATTVSTAGQYGAVAIYGVGETVAIKVWDTSAALEYSNECITITPETPPEQSTFITSPIPPTCIDQTGYALNIDAGPARGDMNDDCQVDITDAVLGLQVVGGGQLAAAPPNGTDANNDLKIGLEEVIYILQKIAGLRN